MKKLLYCAAALAMSLFAGSCQRENLEPDKTNGKVTFTVEVPAELQTKAIADGKNVDQLIYEVWWTKDKVQKDLTNDATRLYQSKSVRLEQDQNDNGIRKATVELDLMNDQNFTVLFWAQVEDAYAYNTENLTAVTYAEGFDEYDSNDESLAAFYSSAYIVDGKHVDAACAPISSTVTLRRPFAQINLGTLNTSSMYDIEVLQSDVKVTSVPTVFNVATKETSEPQEISFQIADIPNDPKTLTVQDKPYDYVAMNYVFAGGDNVAVEYNIYTKIKGVNGEIDAKVNNVVKNVPLKENYRTNIVGNLLTSKVDYQIVVDANFNQPDIDLESLTDGLVQVNPDFDAPATSYTKMYEISSGNGFAFAMMKLVPAMKSGEKAEFYLINSIDMEGIYYVPPTVPTGAMVHLGIGQAPITRSTSGIVITGLDSPIFATVAEGATASFSNISIDNLSGDTNAALVGENDGKVVISNCEASNDQNNEVDLIGDVDNNGTTYDATEVGDIETLKDVLKTGIPQVVISKQLKVTENTVLDLNGTSISAVDSNETGNYAMFEVQPDVTLTVNGPGKITLTATTDRQWSAYSSVISNQRGKLVVNEGVVIEHLGGTSMAYAIDNLTNTGAQDAVTIVNGATVKSKYRAIRQFLNSPTGSNELYVKKGSTVLGDNKAIWPQDANSNANPGILEVEAGAEINDVYLSAANATKQWPLQISIPSSVFVEGGEIVLGTIPTGYEVVENNGVWTISKSYVANGNDYTVYSVKGLEEFAKLFNDANTTNYNLTLAADIDLAGEELGSIGTDEKPFSGTFNGDGHTIKNLSIVESEAKEGKAYLGFFGYAKDATIKNVTFENVNLNIACLDIDHSQGHIGAVAGSLEGTSNIENVTVKGDIKVEATFDANGASRVAVVAGGNSYGNVTMKNVHVIANEGSYLKANNNVGALAGQLQGKSVFEDCSSNIDVTGKKFFAGGIIGLAAGDQTFTNCETTGDITITAGREGRANDHYRVGGIAGGWADGAKNVCTLTNCSYTGKVSGKNADGSVADPLDYDGYVGRGYTLNGCAGSKVVIDGKSFEQVTNNVHGFYKVAGVYEISTPSALVALCGITINGGEEVALTADIDLADVEFNGISAFNPENNNTFDGRGHKVSNWTYEGGASDMGFIKSWVGPIKNVTIKNASLKTAGRSAVLAAKVYSNIENCHVIESKIEDSYWACGLIAGLYNSGSVKNCTVDGCSVMSNGGVGGIVGVMNESSGERMIEKCTVKNTTVNNTGVYGEGYSGALVVGMFNCNATFKFVECVLENNKKDGQYVGDLYYTAEGSTVYVDGILQ